MIIILSKQLKLQITILNTNDLQLSASSIPIEWESFLIRSNS